MWRLVVQQKATLEALETSWSLLDLVDANEVLDAIAEAEAELRARQT